MEWVHTELGQIKRGFIIRHCVYASTCMCVGMYVYLYSKYPHIRQNIPLHSKVLSLKSFRRRLRSDQRKLIIYTSSSRN